MADGRKKKTNIPLIGILALKNQLVTKAELEAGLIQCKDSKTPEADLKSYFLSQELISNKNIQRLTLAAKAITIRQKEYNFGAIALAKGFINKSVLDLALEDQQEDIKNKKKPRLIGDMMVDAGLLTEKQRDYILKLQKRVRRVAPTLSQENKTTQETGQAGGAQEKIKEEKAKAQVKEEKQPDTLLEAEAVVGGCQLQVSSDFMAAFLSKTDAFDDLITASDIKEDLFDKGIVSGIVKDEMIDGFIRSSGFKTQAFRVAKGIRAIQGQDAKIEFFFNTDYLKAGGMDAEGNIDFKERGEIPLVEKGTVLAEKTPRVEARWGQNIYGDEVATDKGEDHALRFGKGAVLSEDGLKILAEVRGFPKYSLAGLIFVHDEYTTGGDVDFETGHIEFDGNVNVKGCIKSGFKVKGNDIATVELDGGVVEADGDLTVAGGINEGKIYARGNVYAKFIHKSEIVCMGDVQVQKEIVDSQIETSSSCIITSGKLISSTVTAKMGVNAKNIGTEMSSPSTIKVGHDSFMEKELKKNKARIASQKENIFALEEKKIKVNEQNAELQREITEYAHVQDRSQLEQRDIEAKLSDPANAGDKNELNRQMAELKGNAQQAEQDLDECFEKSEALEGVMAKIDRDIGLLMKKRDDLAEERNNLTKWAKDNPGKALVACEGSVLPGTTIIGKHSEYIVETLVRRSKITEILFKSQGANGDRTVYQMKVNNF